jgi:hypothetical protein
VTEKGRHSLADPKREYHFACLSGREEDDLSACQQRTPPSFLRFGVAVAAEIAETVQTLWEFPLPWNELLVGAGDSMCFDR